MKFSILTLGCKVNKYESDALIFELKNRGMQTTDKLEEADVYIINTCAVTSEAEKKSRQMIERAKKLNANAKFYIMGCASQNRPDQFENRGVKVIIGATRKKELLDQLEEDGIFVAEFPNEYEDNLFSAQSLSRAYIKIQDGCNRFCTYCLIPYLRGRSRSRDLGSITKEVAALSDEVKEIVLVGIDVSSFEIDGKPGLAKLLKTLDGFGKRLRLSSMEQNIITDEFLQMLSAMQNFCPHFYLSLQSGCDNVLKKMNRKYTTGEYKEKVDLIRKYFPDVAITTDVIVGFPTETDEDFEETCNFVQEINFSQMHIFPYSKREGTAATKLFKDLNGEIKSQRFKDLNAIAQEMKKEFYQKQKGGKMLVEEFKDGYFEGYTENYIKCFLQGDFAVGDVVEVVFKTEFEEGMLVQAK